MNSVQSRLLAATGAVALCFVPVAAHAATPAPAAVRAQDDAEMTSAPEDGEGGETTNQVGEPVEEGPTNDPKTPAKEEAASDGAATTSDGAATTSDGAATTSDGAATTSDGVDGAEQTAEPETTNGEAQPDAGEVDEFGADGIPADDPDFWVDYLSGEGFLGVQCYTELGSGSTYELTEAAEPGTNWLLIVLASDDEGGIFDIISEPQVGEVFSLEDVDGSQASLSAVVLCQADLEMSDVDPEAVLDDLDGEGNAVTEEAVSAAGPKVETDVPATGSNGSLGAIAGLSALLMGAGGVVAGRRLTSRT